MKLYGPCKNENSKKIETMFLYAFLNGYNGYYKTQEVHKNITLKNLASCGWKETLQLASLYTVSQKNI